MKMKEHIVCIDDEPELLAIIRFILEREGFQVTGAVGGRKGLETIQKLKPDLVLLDLMMPDMDGWEVYQQVRSDVELKHIPFIVVTAKDSPIDKSIGLHIAEVDAYLTKPLSPQELVQTIRRVLVAKTEKTAS
jgi:DNA-binding response OmpR family regulator